MTRLELRRIPQTLALIGLLVLGGCVGARTPTAGNALVNDATAALRALKKRQTLKEFRPMLKQAAGVAIFPALYKAGFFIGAEGGNGVLLARRKDGSWGYPAFYTMGTGSFGLQIGAQISEVVLIIRSPGALKAILRHQGKLGADAGIAVAWTGAGVEGGVTSNLNFDVVAFSNNMGLYGGASLEGAAMVRRNDMNAQYYGAGATPEKIILENRLSNAQADGLRAELAAE